MILAIFKAFRSLLFSQLNPKVYYFPSEIKFDKILESIKLSGIKIKDLKIKETKLEDVFLKLTKN